MNTFDPNIYLGPQSTPGYFGMESLNKARAAGYSDAEINASIQAAGFQYGEQAAASINTSSSGSYMPSPSPSPSPSSSTSYFDPNAYLGAQSTPGYFGMESLNKARADGYTDAQINSSVTAAGFQYGEQAAASIQPYTTYPAGTPPAAPKPPTPTQGSTSSGMPQKTASAAPPTAPPMDYSQVYAPPSPRDTTNLYEEAPANAGGDRNSSSSELDYTWQWDEMQGGSAEQKSTEAQPMSSASDEEKSYSDSWRKYTATGQPVAGTIFGA